MNASPNPFGAAIAYDSGIPYNMWLAQFRQSWWQGEHVALIGQTGSGKTFVASDILPIRTYTVVLSIKMHDDTLDRFTRREPKFKRIKKWPIPYNVNRALMVFKPKRLVDPGQAAFVHDVLQGVARSTGWCVFLDDVAYIVNTLGLRRHVVDLLNIGRSSGISLVSAMTQPSSVSASIPSELKKQVRHCLIWRYTGDDEIEACSKITGVNKKLLASLMSQLRVYSDGHDRYTDFIYYCRGYEPQIVRVH